MTTRLLLLTSLLLSAFPAAADEAGDLAARLRAPQGTASVRLRMQFGGSSLQIQTKERRSGSGTEVVYQVLFPKERKGEAVLVKKSGGRAATATTYVPPDQLKNLGSGQMGQGLFGSGLAYEDVADDFFSWPNQQLVGTEDIGRVTCQILESKPGKGASGYASVRSWIDTKRMVPLRVEKYSAPGRLACRIDTTNVEKDDQGRSLPASLSISRTGGPGTIIEGSRIRRGVPFTDADFSPEGLANLALPRGAE
jgi:hypothetical protein